MKTPNIKQSSLELLPTDILSVIISKLNLSKILELCTTSIILHYKILDILYNYKLIINVTSFNDFIILDCFIENNFINLEKCTFKLDIDFKNYSKLNDSDNINIIKYLELFHSTNKIFIKHIYKTYL